MGTIISISNQKGGIGKTTTAQALGNGLNKRGMKTLLVDLDPQGNLSLSMGADLMQNTIYEAIKGEVRIEEVIQYTNQGDIIASNILLSGAEVDLNNRPGREYTLKELLEPLKKKYDFIVIDTAPSLGLLTINSLTAADKVIIPLSADIYSLQGLGQLQNTINSIRKYVNPNLEIEGILLTKFNERTILNRDLKESIEEAASVMNTKLFKVYIREGVAIREAQAENTSIFDYSPDSKPALDYKAFIDEILEVYKA